MSNWTYSYQLEELRNKDGILVSDPAGRQPLAKITVTATDNLSSCTFIYFITEPENLSLKVLDKRVKDDIKIEMAYRKLKEKAGTIREVKFKERGKD